MGLGLVDAIQRIGPAEGFVLGFASAIIFIALATWLWSLVWD